MVLAEHCTRVHRGRLTTATLETVKFDRPHRITLRLARAGAVSERALTERDGTARLG